MKTVYFIAFYLFIISFDCFAQNKKALLIGINNYYKYEDNKTFIDPKISLHGCVNDAKSIKELIVSRFGFTSGNVKELYDTLATRKQILKEINFLLDRSKRGDVAIIYYSGHGMSFPYGKNAAQTAEVICPSDIFTTVNYNKDDSYEYSFIQTSELAALFNKFVDKGVILTVIFDCCHSNGTVGLKKTISTKTMIYGVPKILQREFWEERVEMGQAVEDIYRGKGLIEYGASDERRTNVCGEKNREEAIKTWLDRNGYATNRDICNGSKVTWTNDYDKSKWEIFCEGEVNVKVTFTVKDSCGHMESTSAKFYISDMSKPVIIMPARDSTVDCCGPENKTALTDWLARNGGALAKDECSEVKWTNNFEQLKGDFDTSGIVQVIFTANDACGNKNVTSAAFTIEDNKDPLEYRLSLQETKTIIEFLDGLNNIKGSVDRHGFFTDSWLIKPITDQLVILDTLKARVKQETRYDVTGNLDPIEGTPLMVTLLKNIDSLLVLLNQVPYKEENRIIEKNSIAVNTGVKQPLDFLVPVSDTTDRGDLLNMQTREIDFRDFIFSRNIDTAGNVSSKGFPYKEFDFNPPSQVQGSKFLFISATNDKQKAVETDDERGIRHGLFTKVLIDIFKKNPASISSSAVFDSIIRQFKYRNIGQTPTLRVAVSRKQQNLFGVNPEMIRDTTLVTCLGTLKDTIILNKGVASGLSEGNIVMMLKNPLIKAEVVSLIGEDMSKARIISGSAFFISSGDWFAVTDWKTKSPKIKVYIPNSSCTIKQLDAIIKNYVQPLSSGDKQLLHLNQSSASCAKIFLKAGTFTCINNKIESTPKPLQELNQSAIHQMAGNKNYFIYLPVPAEISAAVRMKCLKDQNIQVVIDPKSADLSYYCAYSDSLKCPVIICNKETIGQNIKSPVHDSPLYYYPIRDLVSVTNNEKTKKSIAENIYQWLLFVGRKGRQHFSARM